MICPWKRNRQTSQELRLEGERERERESEREKSIVIINITIENLGKYGIFLKIWEDKMMKQRMKKLKKCSEGR